MQCEKLAIALKSSGEQLPHLGQRLEMRGPDLKKRWARPEKAVHKAGLPDSPEEVA